MRYIPNNDIHQAIFYRENILPEKEARARLSAASRAAGTALSGICITSSLPAKYIRL